MGLTETKGGAKKLIALIGVIVALILAALLVIAAVVFIYFISQGGSAGEVETTLTESTISPTPGETTVPTTSIASEKNESVVSKIIKPVKKVFEVLGGEVDCEGDEDCYHETASSCRKSETTYETLQATQLRKITGERDGYCVVYFENVEINRMLTTEKWLGLNMTCLIRPEDTAKNILTEVSDFSCEGSLWEELKPFMQK